MKTAFELLDAAPDEQIKRMQRVFMSIASGQWGDAKFTLLNAARETSDQFSSDCAELAEFCNSMVQAS